MQKLITAALSISLGFGLCPNAAEVGFKASREDATDVRIEKNVTFVQQEKTDKYYSTNFSLDIGATLTIENSKNIQDAKAVFYADKDIVLNGNIIADNVNLEFISNTFNAHCYEPVGGFSEIRAESININAEKVNMSSFTIVNIRDFPIGKLEDCYYPGSMSISSPCVEIKDTVIKLESVNIDAGCDAKVLHLATNKPGYFIDNIKQVASEAEYSAPRSYIILNNCELVSRQIQLDANAISINKKSMVILDDAKIKIGAKGYLFDYFGFEGGAELISKVEAINITSSAFAVTKIANMYYFTDPEKILTQASFVSASGRATPATAAAQAYSSDVFGGAAKG